jgi:type VI secretion system protein ImpL
MRFFGTKFPIYLLVTKCDLIQGMTQFCSNLSEKNLDQAMGLLNQEMSSDVMAFHERAVRTIGSRLRDLRLLIFQRFGPKKDPEFLLFPEEFEQIKPGLDRFIESAFQENSHQETPLLRGIFFSSGRQEGKPYSYFMNSLGLIEEREVLPGTNRGLFLKDFFSKILPEDRRLFNPTQKVLKWGRWTTGLALTSWMAIAIVVCGLLSFSFFKTLITLKDVNNDLKPPPVLKGEIFTDVVTMDRFRRAILNIEGRNTKWWIPHFWLADGLEIEKNIKEQYCIRFRDGLLVPFDKHLSDRISSFSTGTSDEILGRHALHIVRRINLLKARLEGMDPAGLGKKPQPFFDTIVVSTHSDILPELTEQFNGLYLFNLSWQDDTSRLSREMNTLQSQLKHLLDLRPNKMHWLVTWINKEPAVSDIMMENFWGNNLSSIRDYSKISMKSRKKKGRKPQLFQKQQYIGHLLPQERK